jgi:acetyltransferase-like isoleucine patch superfamily enzyme
VSDIYVDKKRLLHMSTRLGKGAKLFGEVRTGKNVFIDANATVFGPVEIGSGTYIGPNSVLGFPDAGELKEVIRSKKIRDKKTTSLGEDCIVRPGTSVYSNVRIGNDVVFGHNVLIREDVMIGDHSKVGTNVVVDGKTKIGANVSIQTGVYICTYSTVEDGVFLGPCCVLTNDKYVYQKPYKLLGPTVKRGASIGANALLFPGVTVGEGAVVGSQAMVNSDVPARTVVVGIPAKKIKDVPEDWHSALLKS